MTASLRSLIARHPLSAAALPLTCIGLYGAARYNYNLFHVLAESFSILIAFSVFTIAWNTRRIATNSYVLFLGIAFLFVGVLDFIHTLSYKGMGLLEADGANLPTQFWVIARYMQAVSFLAAIWLIDRPINAVAVVVTYLLATFLLAAAVFSGTMFPDCYIEGRGITPFKTASEYIICFILAAALIMLFRRRERFDAAILRLVALSIASTIVSELAVTFYTSVYGLSNLIGHYFKILAFFFIYRAIIAAGLENPYRLLFYDLQKQREELQTILDASPIMIYYKDLENRFIRINQAVAAATGLPKEAIEGKDAWDVYPGQSEGYGEEDRKVIESGRGRTGIVRPLVTPIGTRWLQTDKFPYRDKDNRIIGTLGFSVDITEQRLAEKELKTTRRFLEIANRHTDLNGILGEFATEIRHITNCEAIGIRLLDRNGDIPYVASLGFNDEFYRLEGRLSVKTDRCLCINVILGKTDPSLSFHTEGGSFYLNEAGRFMSSAAGETLGPTRNVCPRMGYESLALIPIRTEKNIVGLVHLADRRTGMVPLETVRTLEKIAAILGVATQRGLAEAALREAHERAEWLARFPEENPHPVLRADAGGRILYCNPASAKAAEWSCLVGQPLPDPFLPIFRRAMAEGRDAQYDLAIGDRVYAVWVTPFPAERYANLYGRDITTRTRMEEDLKKRTEQLETANKELESFNYTISHDLRAPLRAIDGFTRILLKSHGDLFDEEARRKFSVIRDSARKMGRLIDDLLSFSRYGRQIPSFAVLDMTALVNEVWRDLCAVNPGRRMELRDGTLPEARGDRTLIRQIWANLLANAVKFTNTRDTTVIEVGGRIDGSEIVYHVKDNGIGFDMAYQDKIFGVFQRLHTEKDYEGTGVGLAIVRQIVGRHGGRVWGEGKENEGAVFYFTLPNDLPR